jgi:CheY-like chemotaxis protein
MGQRYRVLIVEDEVLIGFLLEEMVDELGYEVAGVVGRLDQAIATEARCYDFAVLDVSLGATPVFPFADLLASRGTPFAFASGNGGASIPEAHRRAPFLQKPFRKESLAEVLSALAKAAH